MEEETITKELQKFSLTDAAIAQMGKEYLALKIKDLKDVKGYAAVHKARMDVRTRRVETTKVGKELREDALAFQRLVLAEEKRILALLAPIEDHLTTEEKRVDDEKERIKREAEEKEKARIQARVERLEALGMGLVAGQYRLPYEQTYFIPAICTRTDSDEDFEIKLECVHNLINAEEKRQADLEAERKAESERQKKVAAEQEAERQRLEKIAAKQKAEDDRIKKAEAELKHREAIEKAKKEAAEQARKDAEEKAAWEEQRKEALRLAKIAEEREAAERAKRQEEEAAEEARRQEELRPEKEKLLAWADALQMTGGPTGIKSKKCQQIVAVALKAIVEIANGVRAEVKSLETKKGK